MHEDDSAVPCEHQIGATRHVASVEAVPEATGMQGPPQDHFRLGILSPDPRHHSRAGFLIHDIRHTHASIALRQGESILAIARLLGHADPQSTLKYTHPADPMVKEAAETLAAVLGD